MEEAVVVEGVAEVAVAPGRRGGEWGLVMVVVVQVVVASASSLGGRLSTHRLSLS